MNENKNIKSICIPGGPGISVPNTLIPITKFNKLKVIVKISPEINEAAKFPFLKYPPNPNTRPTGPLVKRKNNPSWKLILKIEIPANTNAISPIGPEAWVIK